MQNHFTTVIPRQHSTLLVVLTAAMVGCGPTPPTAPIGIGDADLVPDGSVDANLPPILDSSLGVDASVPVLPPSEPCPDLAPGSNPTFYVCNCGPDSDPDCESGDDSNLGTSAAAPWQTYQAAREGFGRLAADEMVAFCRGGSFVAGETTRWVNASCTAGAPCVVRDYEAPWASGDEGNPIIASEGNVTVFSLDDRGNADHEEGYTFLNLDLRGSGEGRGFFLYNDIDDVLICGVSIDGFDIGVHLSGSNDPAAGSDGRNDRIQLRNSRITNNGSQGWLGSGDDSGIEGSYFENNGFARALLNHNIYLSSPQGAARNIWAVGNELYRSTMVDGECAGASLVVHGQKDGVLIEDNIVREDVGRAGVGCWGISVDTGYSDAESFRDVIIRGNTVINVGNVAIGLNACENCTIENNVVVHEQPRGATGIAAPVRTRGPDDLEMTAITIRNNSILFGPDARGRGIVLGQEGRGHVLTSNAIEYLGDQGNWTCLQLDLPPSEYSVVDYNLCHAPLSSGGWSGGSDLEAWQSATGLDANSTSVSPRFNSVTAPYDLSASDLGAPLVGAGHPSESSPTAHGGAMRDEMPDIGAYER